MSTYGLQRGSVEIESAGPITFGPEGILFLADNRAARVVAVDVADPGGAVGPEPFDVENVDTAVASFLGCATSDLMIRDMAVHPTSHNVYLSVQRGRGDSGQAVLVRIGSLDGSVSDVVLDDVHFSEMTIADAPAEDDERLDTTLPMAPEGEEVQFGERTLRVLRRPIRTSTMTAMAYIDGVLLVAGLSNEEFASKLRRFAFPFGDAGEDNSLEIFHVSHGKWETAAPIRTFVPYESDRSIVAAYTCTPIVHFPLEGTTPGSKTVGRTVAELGSHNQPLDMITFLDQGEEHILVANSTHGLIKIARRDIDAQEALTEPKEPIGVRRETSEYQGVVRLANLADDVVLALQVEGEAHYHLRSLKTSSL
jgi:hypothetical protein